MEDQDQDQDQIQDQEGEDLLKALGIEDAEKEEEEKEDDTPPLLSLTEISKRTGIMYVTLKRYAVLHDSTDLAGLWTGEGRNKKYHPDAVAVFQRLKAESRRGRPRVGAPSRGGVEDPLPPTIVKGKKGGGKGPGAKKGAVKRPAKPAKKKARGVRAERSLAAAPVPTSTALSTQEADRAMAAIERVQLMARYEAVKEVVAPLLREMQRLEVVLGLGKEGVL